MDWDRAVCRLHGHRTAQRKAREGPHQIAGDAVSDVLTERQGSVLGFIREHIDAEGFPPTCEEISAAFGFRSRNAAHTFIHRLARKGAVEVVPGVKRGIRVPTETGMNKPAKAPSDASRHIGWKMTEVPSNASGKEIAARTGRTPGAVYSHTSRKRKRTIDCVLCIARDVIFSPACDTCIARLIIALPEEMQEQAIESHGDQAKKMRQAVARIRGQW